MARNLYLESRVLAADPVELIHILYGYAVTQTQEARAGLERLTRRASVR